MLLVGTTWKSENASLSETHIDVEECKQFLARGTHENDYLEHTILATAYLGLVK